MTQSLSLESVDAFPVPELLRDRVARVHHVPIDFAEGLLKEAKRMLYLCVVSGESVAPSDRVDWAWHEMLMFTKFYKSFAEHIGDFIHHVPNPPPEEDERDETWDEIQASLGKPRRGSETYMKMKANYEKYFGVKPDPLYWP